MITFLFSILEKLSNWEATYQYYKEHFKGTFVVNWLNFWLVLVVVLECICLIIMMLGFFSFILSDSPDILGIGFIAVALNLLVLLCGQRIARDYGGASNLAIYFVIALLGILTINY